MKRITGRWMKALPLIAAAAGVAAVAAKRARRMDLQDKVVLITGGSRGLGLALAHEFGSRGCRVAICARTEATLESARSQLEERGIEVFATPCDVSVREDVDRMIAAVREHYGRVDILINNAGIIMVAPMESLAVEHFEQAMGTMFWGAVYPTLAVLPEMQARGRGNIAIVTSIGGKVAVPHLLAYSAAKFAAVGFCEGLRPEAARFGVNVTTIVPGLMRTGSHRHAVFAGDSAREMEWFGIAASAPVLAMSARRAAHQIVDAVRCGQAERILSPQASLLALAHGISPSGVMQAMTLVNRFLPSSRGEEARPGTSIEHELPAWWQTATAMGRRAGVSLNQQ